MILRAHLFSMRNLITNMFCLYWYLCFVLFCFVLFCSFCFVLFVLFCFVLFCSFCFVLVCFLHYFNIEVYFKLIFKYSSIQVYTGAGLSLMIQFKTRWRRRQRWWWLQYVLSFVSREYLLDESHSHVNLALPLTLNTYGTSIVIYKRSLTAQIT